MTTSFHSAKALMLALPLMCVIAGCCCQAIPCLPDEQQCPTDARRLYWTFGEEAVRRCPCGPDREFHGLKPTEWRSWPEGWRCNDGGWETPVAEPASAYAGSSSVNTPTNEPAQAADRGLGQKLFNPFSQVAQKEPPTSCKAPVEKTHQQTAAEVATSPAAATTTPLVVLSVPPTLEPTPLIKFPEMFEALSRIQAPAAAEAPAPATPPKPSIAKELEPTPSRNVPHVQESLADRVQQHLLDNLTL